jgi:1-acyl-sn-glycerol-3-phosphate acyltransferase
MKGCILLCRIFGVRVSATGALPSPGAYLLVANHFGILEPFVLASQFPVSFVGKAEIGDWPFFGWVARTYGVIFVHRDRQHTVSDFVEQVQERMQAGVPVLVFPEGTTSPDETVLPFKTGAFAAVAGSEHAHVLPLYVRPLSVRGTEITSANRRLVTWAGEGEPFASNLLRIVRHGRIEMEVCMGSPFSAGGRTRKELAREAHGRVVGLRDRRCDVDTFAP